MQRLKQHPDLGGDHWNAALINEAYSVLTNEARRAQYDQDRDAVRSASSASEPTADDEGASPQRSTDDSAANETTQAIDLCRFCRSPLGRQTIADHDAVCPSCASPLCPAEKWNLENDGQRAVNRVPKKFDVVIRTAGQRTTTIEGSAIDVSPNGMQLVSPNDICEGSLIRISSDVIDAVGLVTRCRQHGNSSRWAIGVAFETLRLKHSQGTFVSIEA